MSTASDSVATGDGTTIIDGYKISREERPPISWAPFSSNSWRTRLKRVHTSLVGISSNEADEFKDFETALKKPEDTKSSSKKGRKSSVVPKEELTVASKRRSTKRRSKESEEKSESEKELRHTENALVPPKRKEPKRSDKLVLPKQAYLDISKEVNDGDLDLNIFPGQSVSSTVMKRKNFVTTLQFLAINLVNCGSLDFRHMYIAGRTDESEVSELRMDKSSSVNIKSWPEERIISHFGLKEFTIDISEFPHHELQPSTSSQFVGSGAIRKLSTDELANDEEHSQLSKNKENLVGLEPKKRKRKRSLSSSSSRSCSSSDRGRNNHSCSESGTEPSPQTRNTSKKKGHSERPCVECGRFLDSCVMDWKETLGTSTVWCSRDCIERRVARAHEVLPEGYGALTLIRGDGQLLTTGPTLANLAEFIFKYPEYEPVLPVAKKKQVAKNDQGPDTKKSVSRPLSKDADRVRFNVRRAFSDALLKRAKMDKVKSAMKLCKDVSESIEAALFKSCGSNFSSTSYKTWTKAFIENVADCRNKGFYYRVLTGMISVHKVVTLDRNQMRKPEYSSPLDDLKASVCSSEVPPTSVVEQRDDASVSCDGDKSGTVFKCICLAKQKSQAEAERKEKEEKERQREEDRRFREMLPPIRQPDYARCGGSSGLVDLDCSMNSGRNSADELRRVRTPESTGAACASDDDYAVSYGDPEESSPLFSDEREIEAQYICDAFITAYMRIRYRALGEIRRRVMEIPAVYTNSMERADFAKQRIYEDVIVFNIESRSISSCS
uniref:TFIIS central domain-containing protein n=1 Tax=Angiostrongylus cantonensis TaxID=6313 RepID=A0A158P7K6_ANGCA